MSALATIPEAKRVAELELTLAKKSTAEAEKRSAEERLSRFQEEHAAQIADGDTDAILQASTLQAELNLRVPACRNLQVRADKLAASIVDEVFELKRSLQAKHQANVELAKCIERAAILPHFPAHHLESVLGFTTLVIEELTRGMALPSCSVSVVRAPDGIPVLSSCTAEHVLATHKKISAAIEAEDRRAAKLKAIEG